MSFLVRNVPAAVSSGAATYDAVAQESAALVLRRYSTSFGLATRLLAEPVRAHVRSIYALVRVADEVVDAPRPGSTVEQRRSVLDALEAEVGAALETGHSANLVVHAFALAARECRIGPELVGPFFASMREDLRRTRHDDASFESYVYGSAEVVGLMCLRAFVAHTADPHTAYTDLAAGARRLGAAFQKINFLRDIGEDAGELGRCYFPGVEPGTLDDRQRDALLDDVESDLAAARVALERLPEGSRRAVGLAHALFAELTRRIRDTPAEQLCRQRVRVPGPVKAWVAVRCVAGGDR